MKALFQYLESKESHHAKEILELTVCGCRVSKCSARSCKCVKNGFNCTSACACVRGVKNFVKIN